MLTSEPTTLTQPVPIALVPGRAFAGRLQQTRQQYPFLPDLPQLLAELNDLTRAGGVPVSVDEPTRHNGSPWIRCFARRSCIGVQPSPRGDAFIVGYLEPMHLRNHSRLARSPLRLAPARWLYQPVLSAVPAGCLAGPTRDALVGTVVDDLGPGYVARWLDQYAEHRPEPDEVDGPDQMFLVHYQRPMLHQPVRPAVVATLPAEQRSGDWCAVRADSPGEASGHVQRRVAGSCRGQGPCRKCCVEEILVGDHHAALAWCGGAGVDRAMPPDLRGHRAPPRVRQVS